MIQDAAGKIFHWVLKAAKNPIPPVALDQERDLLVLEKLELVLKNSFRKFNLRLGERNRGVFGRKHKKFTSFLEIMASEGTVLHQNTLDLAFLKISPLSVYLHICSLHLIFQFSSLPLSVFLALQFDSLLCNRS